MQRQVFWTDTEDPTWDDYRLLLAVRRAGDVSGAATELGLSPPTVRARLAILEARFGGALFDGPPRGLSPSALARPLIALAEAMELEAGQFTALAAAEREDTHGTVRVAAPEMLGQHVILAAIGDLKARRPDLRVELTLQTGAVPLIDGQTDIALLPSRPESGDFTFTEIHSVSWGFYAHRDYLSRAGAPQDLMALTSHDLIGVETPSATFDFLAALGLPPDAPAYRFRSDSFTAQFAAVRAGLGIAQCQNRLAARYPELVRVVPAFDPRLPAYLAMREWLCGVARVRLVHDAILEAMKRHVGQV